MVTLVTAVVRPAAAQTATAPVLKAAFLFNLAKFAEWPSEVVPGGGPITMCVLGDSSVAEALRDLVKGHSVGDHAVVVSAVSIDGALRSCQLLYISGVDLQVTTRALTAVAGASVFTVSDLARFAQMGGVAQFFMEGDKLRFAVNTDAAQRGRLRISSKLLALAKIVTDDRTGERRDSSRDPLSDSTNGRR